MDHIQVGDLIRVLDNTLRLVVAAGEKVDYDRVRGDSYRVFEFQTVALKKNVKLAAGILPVIEPVSFYLKGGSMSGAGTGVSMSDITCVGTVDKVTPVVNYRIGRVRLNKA